jgi:hypothetical protein
MAIGASIGGNGAARDEDVIARLLVGGGLLRRARVRRLLLARLLNEARETGEEPEYGEEEAGEEGGVSGRGIARFLIASGILRRRRVRQMVLAHLLRERREGGEAEFGEHEGFEGFEAEEGGPSSERKIARFLIASGILRRRLVRRMVLAHLLRERREGGEAEFEEFGGGEQPGMEAEEGGPSSERKIARFLIVSGILRRRRVRQMVLAHLLRERREGGEAEFGEHEHEGFEAEEEGGGEDRRIIRQLVATGVLRKRRIRRMLLARLLRERGEFGEEGGEMEGEEAGGEEWGGGGEWGGGFGRQRGRRGEQMAAE